MKNIIDKPVHYLDGKKIDWKKAVPKNKNNVRGQQRSSHPLQQNLKNKEPIAALKIKPGQLNRFSGRIITSNNTENPFSIALPFPNEPMMSKGSMEQSSNSQMTLCSSLQKGSNSYFPVHQNRFSCQSHKWNEISEAIDEKSSPDSTKTFDSNVVYQAKIPQRHSLQGNLHSSFSKLESDEQKFSKNKRKIFIGGLPHGISETGTQMELSETEFTAYFAKYGEIEDSVIIHDKETGKPRGFGFVTYKNEKSAALVMKDKYKHKIKGKWVECKLATPKAPEIGGSGPGYENVKASYNYGSDLNLASTKFNPNSRKFSAENMRFSDVIEREPKRHSQLNKENPFSLQKSFVENDKSSSVISETDIKSENNCSKFSQLKGEKTINASKIKMEWDNDNLNTYSKIFEDGHESDNGSDWKISK